MGHFFKGKHKQQQERSKNPFRARGQGGCTVVRFHNSLYCDNSVGNLSSCACAVSQGCCAGAWKRGDRRKKKKCLSRSRLDLPTPCFLWLPLSLPYFRIFNLAYFDITININLIETQVLEEIVWEFIERLRNIIPWIKETIVLVRSGSLCPGGVWRKSS